MQSVELRSGSIKFKNYFKQFAVLFKVYVDFESVLKGVKSNDNGNNASYTKKYLEQFPRSFAYKIVCIDDTFSKPVILYIEKKCNQEIYSSN